MVLCGKIDGYGVSYYCGLILEADSSSLEDMLNRIIKHFNIKNNN